MFQVDKMNNFKDSKYNIITGSKIMHGLNIDLPFRKKKSGGGQILTITTSY